MVEFIIYQSGVQGKEREDQWRIISKGTLGGDFAYGEIMITHHGVYFSAWLIPRFISQWTALRQSGYYVSPVGITNR